MEIKDITVFIDNEQEVTAVKCCIDGINHLTCDIRENHFNKTMFTAVFSKITLLTDEWTRQHYNDLKQLSVLEIYTKKDNYTAEYLGNQFNMVFLGFNEILT